MILDFRKRSIVVAFDGSVLSFTEGAGGEGDPVASAGRTLQRLEVWSTWQCAGGARTAFIPLSEVAAHVTIERTAHDDEGSLVVSKESAAAAELTAEGAVLRQVFTDGSFTEWIIWAIDDSSRESRVLRVTLRSVLTTLDTGAEMLSETTSGVTTVDLEWKALAPATHVTQVLAFAPSWWTVGTITPTIPVDLTPSGWMPLRAFRELVAAIRAQAVSCELHYRRNGTAGYFVDIVTSIGSTEDTLDVRTAKNLLGTSRRRDREKYAVEVVPLGTGSPRATIGKAWWEVTGKATDVLTMQQPVTGGRMIAFDDQLNGLYLIDDTGARQQITDSVAGSTQTVTVASGTNFTVGRWYRVAANSSGDELVRLRKAEATAGIVKPVESSSLDGTTNLVTNPAQRVWTGAASSPPDGWTQVGGTITRTSTSGLWVYGGRSARCVGPITLESPAVSFYVPTWATSITISMWVYHVGGLGTTAIDFRRDGATISSTAIDSGPFNVWRRVTSTASLTGLTGAVHNWTARLNNAGGSSTTYVDSVQVTLSAAEQEFTEGSNPAKLWALGNQHLSAYSTVPTSYGVSFANLGEWDPVGFPYDAVALGQTANVYDSDLGVTTAGRIIELRRDWKNPLASHLTISTRPEEFVSLLTGIAA